MTKKIEHLTKEVKDLFPKENNQSLQKHLTSLSEVQDDFFPGKKFKMSLKMRLQHLHQCDNQKIFSIYSFFRFAGLGASFVFVSGFSYFYYVTQQVPLETQILEIHSQSEDTLQDIIPNVSLQEVIGDTPLESETSVEMKDTLQKSFSPAPVFKKTIPIQEEDITQRQADTRNGEYSDFQEQKIQEISPSRIQLNTDEYIVSDIVESFGDVQTGPQEDTPSLFQAESRMMLPVEDIFSQTCLSYSGALSPDGEKCFFDEEAFCIRENIFSESEKVCEFLPKNFQKK